MGQQLQARLQPWRSGNRQDLWLSMLIDTMEEVARPEIRAMRCDISLLAAVKAQLARPAPPRGYYGSDFSLRN
jgi:truncated hemoglobin YjbI